MSNFMKKKSFLAALMALVMLCTVFSCGITAVAADDSTAYGADAYSYVQYLDANLRARVRVRSRRQKPPHILRASWKASAMRWHSRPSATLAAARRLTAGM